MDKSIRIGALGRLALAHLAFDWRHLLGALAEDVALQLVDQCLERIVLGAKRLILKTK